MITKRQLNKAIQLKQDLTGYEWRLNALRHHGDPQYLFYRGADFIDNAWKLAECDDRVIRKFAKRMIAREDAFYESYRRGLVSIMKQRIRETKTALKKLAKEETE